MVDRVEAVAAEEGMVWRHRESLHVGTVDAHRLLHLALHDGGTELQGRLKEALLSAYFAEARNVADHDVLREIAVGVGLDAAAVDRVLASDEHLAEVWADIERAQAYGAGSAVPGPGGEVRRLRRAAGRPARAGAGAGVVRAPARGADPRQRPGVRPRRLRDLSAELTRRSAPS